MVVREGGHLMVAMPEMIVTGNTPDVKRILGEEMIVTMIEINGGRMMKIVTIQIIVMKTLGAMKRPMDHTGVTMVGSVLNNGVEMSHAISIEMEKIAGRMLGVNRIKTMKNQTISASTPISILNVRPMVKFTKCGRIVMETGIPGLQAKVVLKTRIKRINKKTKAVVQPMNIGIHRAENVS
jgi:hypothetical protein